MNLFDELRDYAEGEEPRGQGDDALLDAVLDGAGLAPPVSATASAGLSTRAAAAAVAGVVGTAALVYALWPSGSPAPTPPATPAVVEVATEAELPDEPSPSEEPAVVDAPPEPTAPPLDEDPGAAPQPEPVAKSTPPLNTLLERAQAHRKAGEHARARATYRLAIRSYPKEKAAKRALVALGDLELNRLGNAKAALASFERYIAKGADPVLIQEAAYGRIRALRRLGRDDREQTAIEEFLAEYPRSPYQAALKKRMQELDTPLVDPTL